MEKRNEKILRLIDEAHSEIEGGHQELRALKGEEGKVARRRFILADLACHLVQDAIDNEATIESLKNHLYAILTVCDDFLPEKKLKIIAKQIIE